MSLDFWYDGQLRRYWMQFCRIFEGFQYESGVGASGSKTLRTFPVSLAGKNRQVGHILRNGSENTMLSTPRITCEMIDIQQSSERRQNPNHVSSVNIFERAIDPVTNRYTGELGKTYTVERFMAIPYDVTMRVNIWTSNEEQKHQFMEQVLVLFNPSIDLQTGDNPIDWTSLTIVELDNVTWSNRELPIGTDDDIEIATLTFRMPIWLTPPAKIKRQNIIHQIITNIGEMNQNHVDGQAGGYNYSSNDLHTRVIVTPGNHQVRVEVVTEDELVNGEWKKIKRFVATLLSEEGHHLLPNWKELAKEHDIDYDPDHLENLNDPRLVYDWRQLLVRYGQYRKGVSQFRLKITDDMDDHDSDIVGIFDFHSTRPNVLYWSPSHETMPTPTMQSINAMIDLSPVTPPLFKSKEEEDAFVPPRTARWPGDGVLPEAKEKDRYLLASDLYYDYVAQGEPYPVGWDFGIPNPEILQFRLDTTDPRSGEVLEQKLYFVDDNTKREVTYADLPGRYEVGKFVIRGTELVERTVGNKWLARVVLETRHLVLDRVTGNYKTTTYPSEIVLARANDIIEFKDGKWQVVFDSSEENDEEVVLNMASGKHLRWTSGMWVDAVSGDYNPGYWRVFL